MACFFTKIFSTDCFRRTSGCVSIGAILNPERWTRTEPRRDWWKQFLRDTGGTGFWHELYSVRGGLKRCMSTSNDRRAFSVLLIQYLKKAASSRLASDCTVAE